MYVGTTLHGVVKQHSLWQKFILPSWPWSYCWFAQEHTEGNCVGWLVAVLNKYNFLREWVIFAHGQCTRRVRRPKDSFPQILICCDLLKVQQIVATVSNLFQWAGSCTIFNGIGVSWVLTGAGILRWWWFHRSAEDSTRGWCVVVAELCLWLEGVRSWGLNTSRLQPESVWAGKCQEYS